MNDATEKVQSIRLWEGKAPMAVGDEPIDVPKIDVFHPKEPDGSAIVVCPGGGYANLADHESEPVAQWLNTLGITAVLLTYRLGPRYKHPAMLIDVSRAIRTTRARAEEWKLDRKRVGVLGFSAGGHLSATVSTIFDSDPRSSRDPIDQISARPDVSVLLYPVITLVGVSAHTGSRKRLLDENPHPDLLKQLCCDEQVNPHTPPAFLFHTVGDQGVPVENSMQYAAAMRKAGVPFELHLFERGKHGVGLAAKDPALSRWPELCAAWLRLHGFATKPQS